MQPEHLVLCGGLRPIQRQRAKIHRLDVSGSLPNVQLRISDIRRALVTNVQDVLTDLLEIAAYVYCADGTVRRGGSKMSQLGKDWRRRFRFVIPVRLPNFWSSILISTLLVDALSFLSDDFYFFEFEQLRDPQGFQRYLDLDGAEARGFRADEVVLFSGGLDSLAGAVAELGGDTGRIALVSHGSAPKIASHQSYLVEALSARFGNNRIFHVPVWVYKHEAIGKEFTQRSRSFLYAALGFVVARIFGLPRLRFFENGVVSLNLPIVSHELGARASRTTHPQVISGFTKLFSAVAGISFTVENPFLWKTKSEIVKSMAHHGCAELICHTVSCTRVREMTVAQTHCGVCSQCLDRRFAVLAAGLASYDPGVLYRLDPLIGDVPRGDSRTLAEAYVRSASDIERMNDLAFFGRFGEAGRAVRFLSESANEAGRKIFELYKRHASEVCAVIDDAIRSNASALRAHALPGSCLLVLALPKRGDVDAFVRSKPFKDPAELEYEGELNEARSRIEIRIAFDDDNKAVTLWSGEQLGGASYSLLNSLRPGYDNAKRAGLAPENYPFVDGRKLADQLNIEESALRRRISRLRRHLDKCSIACGYGPLSPDAVIENEPRGGYRLNPAVLVLAASELPPHQGVTFRKR